MQIKDLLRRVVVDLGIVMAVVLLVGGSIVGYVWVKEGPQRAESRKQAEAFLRDLTAEIAGLNALGDVNLEPPNVTLADLEQKLHQPVLRVAGAQNTTKLGWACGGKECAIFASFIVPFGQEIPPTMVPAGLLMIDPAFAKVKNVGVGGIHLGETSEDVETHLRGRKIDYSRGKKQFAWDKDWNVVWVESNGKVLFLSLANEKMMGKAKASGDSKSIGPERAGKE